MTHRTRASSAGECATCRALRFLGEANSSSGNRTTTTTTTTMRDDVAAVLCALLLLCGTLGADAIRCYQCSSDTDPKNEDLCGAYTKFDKERNVPIECNSEESHMPGTFCVKLTEQSPRGFIWDGRWRQVVRRCASVASTGVTGVCNWGVRENGVYWQECYCAEDSCNAASSLTTSLATLLLTACGVAVALLLTK